MVHDSWQSKLTAVLEFRVASDAEIEIKSEEGETVAYEQLC